MVHNKPFCPRTNFEFKASLILLYFENVSFLCELWASRTKATCIVSDRVSQVEEETKKQTNKLLGEQTW